jgi:hypothetical protein
MVVNLIVRTTLGVALIVLAGTACFLPRSASRTHSGGIVSGNSATISRAGIAIVGSGGVAGLERIMLLDSATARYMTVTRKHCPTACAAIDSASGLLNQTEVAHIYAVVDGVQLFDLRDDYGVCRNCADQTIVTTAVFANGRHKVITTDSETTPEILGRVHVALADAIRGARSEGNRE